MLFLNTIPKFVKLTRTYRKSPKFNMIIPYDLHEIICAIILGDLHVEGINVNGNTRLQFKYSTINEVYLYHLYL